MEQLPHNAQRQLNKIEGQISLIVAALNGNPMAEGEGNGGLVKNMADLKATLSDFVVDTNDRLLVLETFKNRAYWTWILIISASAVIASVVGIVISYLSFRK